MLGAFHVRISSAMSAWIADEDKQDPITNVKNRQDRSYLFAPDFLVLGVSTSKVLEMVVVVFPCEEAGSPFSMSAGAVRFLGAGGELRRTPVRRFWRLC